jgi:hypothetical protein
MSNEMHESADEWLMYDGQTGELRSVTADEMFDQPRVASLPPEAAKAPIAAPPAAAATTAAKLAQ